MSEQHPNKVTCGVNTNEHNLVGWTVSRVRNSLAAVMSIDPSARAQVNGRTVDDSYVINAGEHLEFVRASGEKGLCHLPQDSGLMRPLPSFGKMSLLAEESPTPPDEAERRPRIAMLGQGVYTFAEAAALTTLKRSRVREWFRGRLRGPGRKPLLVGDYPAVEGDYAISFYDLIDVYVAGQLREHGASLPAVRKVYKHMGADLHSPHPFCRKELLTDGKMVFLRGLDPEGQQQLTEVLTGQGVFLLILLPFLKQIDYDPVKLLARRWRIAEMVVIDPAICFGKPIIEAVGMPTAILAASYRANGDDAAVVARWYDVEPKHVLAAVEFEDNMAA